MKKKKSIKTIIRQIVREEVAMAIQEVITELKQPTQSKPQPKKIANKKSYSKNSVLNDVLNETAASDEWKTLGGDTFDSSKMNQVMSGQYSDVMNNNSQAPISVDGQTPDFLKKDYRKLMKAIDKKQGKV
tara:strand:- start:29537 stop:29926 length:390 start_codon:yes stop_codon:yes gene_type:complete